MIKTSKLPRISKFFGDFSQPQEPQQNHKQLGRNFRKKKEKCIKPMLDLGGKETEHDSYSPDVGRDDDDGGDGAEPSDPTVKSTCAAPRSSGA